MAIARATNGILQQGKTLLDRVISIGDPDLRESHIAMLRKAVEILQEHATQEAAISVNPNLTEQGQRARVQELAKETLAKLAFLAERADALDQAYARAEALVYAVPDPPKGTNEVVQFLREDSIRRRLEPLTPAERVARYQVAIHRADVETIRAFRLAPGEPFIEDEIRQRLDQQLSDASDPKGMRRLRALDAARSQLHELADSLVGWLKGYGARIEFATPDMKSAQWLIGYGHEVKFGLPPVTPPATAQSGR